MKRITALMPSPGLRDIMTARALAVEAAAVQPKRRKKRKPARVSYQAAKAKPVPVVAAKPIERRGESQLVRLGQAMRLEPVVKQRREELADLESLMRSKPRR